MGHNPSPTCLKDEVASEPVIVSYGFNARAIWVSAEHHSLDMVLLAGDTRAILSSVSLLFIVRPDLESVG